MQGCPPPGLLGPWFTWHRAPSTRAPVPSLVLPSPWCPLPLSVSTLVSGIHSSRSFLSVPYPPAPSGLSCESGSPSSSRLDKTTRSGETEPCLFTLPNQRQVVSFYFFATMVNAVTNLDVQILLWPFDHHIRYLSVSVNFLCSEAYFIQLECSHPYLGLVSFGYCLHDMCCFLLFYVALLILL